MMSKTGRPQPTPFRFQSSPLRWPGQAQRCRRGGVRGEAEDGSPKGGDTEGGSMRSTTARPAQPGTPDRMPNICGQACGLFQDGKPQNQQPRGLRLSCPKYGHSGLRDARKKFHRPDSWHKKFRIWKIHTDRWHPSQLSIARFSWYAFALSTQDRVPVRTPKVRNHGRSRLGLGVRALRRHERGSERRAHPNADVPDSGSDRRIEALAPAPCRNRRRQRRPGQNTITAHLRALRTQIEQERDDRHGDRM